MCAQRHELHSRCCTTITTTHPTHRPTRIFSSCKTSSVPTNNNSSSPNLGNHHSTFSLDECDYSRQLILVESKYLSFCDWLMSLIIISSRFIYVVACVRISFLKKAKKISHYMYIHFVYYSSAGHLVASTFWLLIKYILFISKRMTISQHCTMNTVSKEKHRCIWEAPSSLCSLWMTPTNVGGNGPGAIHFQQSKALYSKATFRGRRGLLWDLYLVTPNLYPGPYTLQMSFLGAAFDYQVLKLL